MTKTIEVRHDSKGQEIKLHDVLRNEETGEMAIVVHGSNKSGVKGLAIKNEIIGTSDWLDVFPDGVWTIVGNGATSGYEEEGTDEDQS